MTLALKNNPGLEYFSTVNLIKVKHASKISSLGRSLKYMYFFEASNQAVGILQNNTQLLRYRQDSRSHDPKYWTNPRKQKSKNETSSIHPPFSPFHCPESYETKILSLVPSETRKKFFETTVFSYSASDPDGDEDQEAIDENDGLLLGEAFMDKNMRINLLDHLTESFSARKNAPTEEEKKIFKFICEKCVARTFFENDWGRTKKKKSRMYSLVQPDTYFDFLWMDHHRARSTYHEAFTFLECTYSADGKERRFFVTDYENSNFEKKEFHGKRLIEEVKIRLFGDKLFVGVDVWDVLKFFLILSGAPIRLNLNWIKKFDKGELRVDERAYENEASDSDEDSDDYPWGGEKKTKENRLFGSQGAVINLMTYVNNEIFDDDFSWL